MLRNHNTCFALTGSFVPRADVVIAPKRPFIRRYKINYGWEQLAVFPGASHDLLRILEFQAFPSVDVGP